MIEDDNPNIFKEPDGEHRISPAEMLTALKERHRLLLMAPLLAAIAAFTVTTYVVQPTFTAATTFIPPQQPQNSAASALASLGSLASIVGGPTLTGGPGERYIALMLSVTVSDRILDRFKLLEVYNKPFRIDARKTLAKNVRINLGKKDGLITVEVDDVNPKRAADIANQYVDELRRIAAGLSLTEAQQRRVFFERQLQKSRDSLALAQQALQSSGFSSAAMKAEPKAAAETYGRLKAEFNSAEVRLNVLRGSMSDSTPEVRQQQTTVSMLRENLTRAERATDTSNDTNYVGKYRDFKYQEAMFELNARQFELARLDESREGALIQVVDSATPPEKKSKPIRVIWVTSSWLATLLTLMTIVLLRRSVRRAL